MTVAVTDSDGGGGGGRMVARMVEWARTHSPHITVRPNFS